MGETIIQVEHAVKKFRGQTVLSDINLCFEKGKIYGVIGRNGSGKTVLFKCICGLMRLTSGSITVEGKIIGKDIDFPKNVGMIIEHPGFLPHYNGYENLKMLASYRNMIGKQEIKDAIRTVGLDPEDKKRVGKYSLGMRQRLGIAQAIMEHPDILILDEPMNGLDNNGVEDIRSLLLGLKEWNGATILLASHNREDIQILCDEVIEMNHGMIVKRESV